MKGRENSMPEMKRKWVAFRRVWEFVRMRGPGDSVAGFSVLFVVVEALLEEGRVSGRQK